MFGESLLGHNILDVLPTNTLPGQTYNVFVEFGSILYIGFNLLTFLVLFLPDFNF